MKCNVIQSPFMNTRYFLLHRRQKSYKRRFQASCHIRNSFSMKICILNTLRIEEASHPKLRRSPTIQPSRELLVPLQQFRKPESQRGRLPRSSFPSLRYPGVVYIIESISQFLKMYSYLFTLWNTALYITIVIRDFKEITSLIIIMPSIARRRSFSITRINFITICILSISCFKKMFIGAV